MNKREGYFIACGNFHEKHRYTDTRSPLEIEPLAPFPVHAEHLRVLFN